MKTSREVNVVFVSSFGIKLIQPIMEIHGGNQLKMVAFSCHSHTNDMILILNHIED